MDKKMMELLKSLIKGFEEKTGVKFTGELKTNGRLSRVLGRCRAIVTTDRFTGEIKRVNPVSIEISKKFLEIATYEEMVDVLAHEYAHYCTYKTIGQHNHSTREFVRFCNILGTSQAPSMSTKNKIRKKYEIFCTCCGKFIQSNTNSNARVVKNPNNFKSGCCKAPVRVQKNF